jgi:nucleoside 2-deoxyribosyltransferase
MAGRVSKRHILQVWADDLEAKGFEVVSRWSMRNSDHVAPGMKSEKAAPSERVRFAREDLEDIDACDIMVCLMEEPRNDSRGGRHVEFGYALARDKAIYIVGEKETVFHELPQVAAFTTWELCLNALTLHADSCFNCNLRDCDQCRSEQLADAASY